MKLIYNVHTMPSPGHMISEDSCRMLGNHVAKVRQAGRGQLFGLFDGMGSLERGGDAARYMGDMLLDFCSPAGTPLQRVREILLQGNDAIAAWKPTLGSKYQRAGGCAGTVALLLDSMVHVFHVGDTVALLLKGDYDAEDECTALTRPHSSPHHGITSFWGIGPNLRMEYRRHAFSEDDLLLLASDGLTDVMGNSEIAACVREMAYFSPEECGSSCRALCGLARRRGSGDDISVMLIYREE